MLLLPCRCPTAVRKFDRLFLHWIPETETRDPIFLCGEFDPLQFLPLEAAYYFNFLCYRPNAHPSYPRARCRSLRGRPGRPEERAAGRPVDADLQTEDRCCLGFGGLSSWLNKRSPIGIGRKPSEYLNQLADAAHDA